MAPIQSEDSCSPGAYSKKYIPASSLSDHVRNFKDAFLVSRKVLQYTTSVHQNFIKDRITTDLGKTALGLQGNVFAAIL